MEDIKKFYDSLDNIVYGWRDKDGNIHENLKGMQELYSMQSPEEVFESNHGICWELCEIEREYFEKRNINCMTIMAYNYQEGRHTNHTFLVFELNNKWYWFEASWANKKGIHEYNSVKEILDFYRNNFEDFTRASYNPESMLFFNYNKMDKGTTTFDFITTCLKSEQVKE